METKMVVAVKAIACFENKYLIVKRSKYDEAGAGTWEFPGGKIEFGESLEEGLIREVSEETGLDVTALKLLYATTFMTNPSRQIILISYKCTAPRGDVRLSIEHSDYLWAAKAELRETLGSAIVADMDRYGVFEVLD